MIGFQLRPFCQFCFYGKFPFVCAAPRSLNTLTLGVISRLNSVIVGFSGYLFYYLRVIYLKT